MDGRVLFAVPNKGPLKQAALELLQDADIHVRCDDHTDVLTASNLPVTLVFVPVSDIPALVFDGHADLGIARSDHVRPSELLEGTVATRLVDLASTYFAQPESSSDPVVVKSRTPLAEISQPVRTPVARLHTSFEAVCAVGVAHKHAADYRGRRTKKEEPVETSRALGFRTIDTILDLKAVLIECHSPSNAKVADAVAARMHGIIASRQTVLCQFNVERNSLGEAIGLTGSKRTPTVRRLDQEGWVNVRAVVDKSTVATTMDQLSLAGAEDIMVMKIANTRTRWATS